MHDLMHDLADSISGNDCFILQQSSSHREIPQGSTAARSLQHEAQHLSLHYVSNQAIATMEEILATRARTILVQSEWLHWDKAKFLSMTKSKFMSLRALKTFSTEGHMKNLKHLHYLDCSNSNISALPEAITMMYSLQTLKLISCT